jgi:hypothetical protein
MQIQMNKQFGQHSYTFEDINDVHEVWEFVDLSLMPTVIKHKDEVFASLSLSLSLYCKVHSRSYHTSPPPNNRLDIIYRWRSGDSLHTTIVSLVA